MGRTLLISRRCFACAPVIPTKQGTMSGSGQGDESYDVKTESIRHLVLKNYGMVPEETYNG